MKGIQKTTLIGSKVLEILHWLLAALMLAGLICSFAAKDWLAGLLQPAIAENGFEIATYGFEVCVADSTGTLNMTALMLFFLGAFLVLNLMAMVFRNIHLMLKKCEGGSPFQKDNIRMLREIGIFSIAVPLTGLLVNIVIRLAVGTDAVEARVGMDGIIMGLIVLCLTQFFAYGAKLENDVDGLV